MKGQKLTRSKACKVKSLQGQELVRLKAYKIKRLQGQCTHQAGVYEVTRVPPANKQQSSVVRPCSESKGNLVSVGVHRRGEVEDCDALPVVEAIVKPLGL